MISSKPLSTPSVDLKQTRPLALGKPVNLAVEKSSKSPALPYTEQTPKHQRLNQHFNQVIEQQIGQIADTPHSKPIQQPPTGLNPSPVAPAERSELLELLDLDQSINTRGQLSSHKPLALGTKPHTAPQLPQSVERPQHKPLALAEKPSSLDVQLLTEPNSALLLEPSQQFMTILQDLLANMPQKNPVYWLENTPPPAATEVANAGTQTPNLAWQTSLWF